MSHAPPSIARNVARSRKLDRLLVIVIAVGMMLILLMQAVSNIQNQRTLQAIRNTQTNGSPVVRGLGNTLVQVKALASQVKDCVSPTGGCYKDGQARTGAAVQVISDQSLYSTLCAYVVAPKNVDADTITAMRRCMALATREDGLR